jgi:hypothetical protein
MAGTDLSQEDIVWGGGGPLHFGEEVSSILLSREVTANTKEKIRSSFFLLWMDGFPFLIFIYRLFLLLLH